MLEYPIYKTFSFQSLKINYLMWLHASLNFLIPVITTSKGHWITFLSLVTYTKSYRPHKSKRVVHLKCMYIA